MINRIKLVLFDESHKMLEFQRNGTTWFKCCFQPGRKIIDIWHVGIDVVADNEIRLLSIRSKLMSNVGPKKPPQHRNSKLLGRISGALCRFNT